MNICTVFVLLDVCLTSSSPPWSSPKSSIFVLLNSYTTGLSASTMGYMLSEALTGRFGGKVVSDELGLMVRTTGNPLPCGAVSRWSK